MLALSESAQIAPTPLGARSKRLPLTGTSKSDFWESACHGKRLPVSYLPVTTVFWKLLFRHSVTEDFGVQTLAAPFQKFPLPP